MVGRWPSWPFGGGGAESPPLQPASTVAKPRQGEDFAPCLPATRDLLDLLMDHYAERSTRRIHSETIIGAAAALTGEFALRSLELTLPRQGFVFGDPINGVLFEDAAQGRPAIWELFRSVARGVGVSERELPDIADIVRRVAQCAAHIQATGYDGGGFPPITVPRANIPHEWSPNACPRFRRKVMAIGKKLSLTPRQLAFAMAITTTTLIRDTRDVLRPVIAFRLAAEIMFSTAKMAPLEKECA